MTLPADRWPTRDELWAHLNQCSPEERAAHLDRILTDSQRIADLQVLLSMGTGTDLMPTTDGKADVGWWYQYLQELDSQWRSRITRILLFTPGQDFTLAPRASKWLNLVKGFAWDEGHRADKNEENPYNKGWHW